MNDDEDELLNFLTEGLVGRQRDLVTRSYYALTQGNPDSGPVHLTSLLTACTLRIVQAPAALRAANTDFTKNLVEARGLEQRLIERVDRSNASVIVTFKDEVARTSANLQTTNDFNRAIGQKAEGIFLTAKNVILQGQSLAAELRQIKLELTASNTSNTVTAQAAEKIATAQEVLKSLVSHLTDMACIHWMTIGIGIGSVLTLVAMQVPWWVALLLFALAIGLLQGLARMLWNYAREQADKIEKMVQAEP